MARRFLTVAAALALFALPLAAQTGVAGKWNASVDTPQGPFALVFEFIVDAAGKLTGTMQNEFSARSQLRTARSTATTSRSSCRSRAGRTAR